MSAKLGELLLKENILTPQQLREALDYQRTHGGRLGSVLTKLKLISDEEVSLLLSKQYGVPSLNLELEEIDPNVIKIIPEETVRKYLVLPVSRNGAVLTLAMVDPGNVFAIDDIKFMTGLSVEQVVTSEASLLRAIDRYYVREKGLTLAEPMGNISGSYGVFSSATSAAIAEAINEFGEDDAFNLELLETDEEINIDEAIQGSTEAPVIKLVNLLLVNALEYDASDIHIEPYEKEFRIRFRVDGSLREVMRPPQKLRDSLISRIKIMARLDIAEKRLPQDGRIRIKLRREGRSRDLDFRVSTLPTIWGEKVVMRLLDKEKLMLDMTKLGFEPQSLERFKRQIAKPYGMVLVTGPTGSGKTNTLYSAISSLNTPDTNIITAEDPVEFNLTGINQLQVKEQIGLNFAAALRSFLRQDPNIILVGEIRDFETAEIAVKASLTGHLVLSTLHTNDAPSTITRLMNMGIEPFLVATSVNLIQAQRLVRRICNDCKAPAKAQPPLQTLLEIGFSPEDATSITVVEGTGRDKTGRECVTCKGSGYKGRTGLFEVLEMTEELRELVLVGASAHEIRKKAMEDKPGYKGMLTLRQSGLEKIKNGVTTIEEIVRETVL